MQEQLRMEEEEQESELAKLEKQIKEEIENLKKNKFADIQISSMQQRPNQPHVYGDSRQQQENQEIIPACCDYLFKRSTDINKPTLSHNYEWRQMDQNNQIKINENQSPSSNSTKNYISSTESSNNKRIPLKKIHQNTPCLSIRGPNNKSPQTKTPLQISNKCLQDQAYSKRLLLSDVIEGSNLINVSAPKPFGNYNQESSPSPAQKTSTPAISKDEGKSRPKQLNNNHLKKIKTECEEQIIEMLEVEDFNSIKETINKYKNTKGITIQTELCPREQKDLDIINQQSCTGGDGGGCRTRNSEPPESLTCKGELQTSFSNNEQFITELNLPTKTVEVIEDPDNELEQIRLSTLPDNLHNIYGQIDEDATRCSYGPTYFSSNYVQLQQNALNETLRQCQSKRSQARSNNKIHRNLSQNIQTGPNQQESQERMKSVENNINNRNPKLHKTKSEITFQPQLSKRSLLMAESMENPRIRLQYSFIKTQQKIEKIRQSVDSINTFQPEINKHSKILTQRLNTQNDEVYTDDCLNQVQGLGPGQITGRLCSSNSGVCGAQLSRNCLLTTSTTTSQQSQNNQTSSSSSSSSTKQPQRWEQLYNLNKHRQKELQQRIFQRQKEQCEDPELTFQPRLNQNHFIQYSENELNLVERCYFWAKKKEERIKLQREQEQQRHLSNCTFQPSFAKKGNSLIQNGYADLDQSPNKQYKSIQQTSHATDDVGGYSVSNFQKQGIIDYFERIDRANKQKADIKNKLNKNCGDSWKNQLTKPQEFNFMKQYKSATLQSSQSPSKYHSRNPKLIQYLQQKQQNHAKQQQDQLKKSIYSSKNLCNSNQQEFKQLNSKESLIKYESAVNNLHSQLQNIEL